MLLLFRVRRTINRLPHSRAPLNHCRSRRVTHVREVCNYEYRSIEGYPVALAVHWRSLQRDYGTSPEKGRLWFL